jgi:5'(3')-deoxyribonucleotidase
MVKTFMQGVVGQKHFLTIGLYSELTKAQRDIIHDKKSRLRESPMFNKEIIQFILKKYENADDIGSDIVAGVYGKHKRKYAIYLTSTGMDALNESVSGKYDNLDKFYKKILDTRIIFCTQERQACG